MQWLEKWFVNSWIIDSWHKYLNLPRFFKFTGKIQGNLLEIGCGKGTTTKEIIKKFPNVKITAIDYDDYQIKNAKQKFPRSLSKQVHFEQGDATKLRFKDESFYFVLELNTFHHIENYEKGMEEAYRVLKRNGKFIIMDLSRYFIFHAIKFLFPAESAFTRKEFEKKLIKNGFLIEKSKGLWLFYIVAKKL